MYLNLKKIVKVLREFTEKERAPLEVIILGGIAMEYYGMKNRKTRDLDAEVKGNVEKLLSFLKRKGIPADIGEDISRWGVISMPPDYRERAILVEEDKNLKIKVLHPLHFVISKLRRGTELDWEDVYFVIKKYKLKKDELRNIAEIAIKNSPKDTSIFIFKKSLQNLLKNCNCKYKFCLTKN